MNQSEGVSVIQTFCISIYWATESILWILWCAACVPPAEHVQWRWTKSGENVGPVIVSSLVLKYALLMLHALFKYFGAQYSMAYGFFTAMMGLDLVEALIVSLCFGRWWRRRSVDWIV